MGGHGPMTKVCVSGRLQCTEKWTSVCKWQTAVHTEMNIRVQVADCCEHRNEHLYASGRLLCTQKWTSLCKWQTAVHTEMNILVQIADCYAHRNEHPCASGRLLCAQKRTSMFCKMQAVSWLADRLLVPQEVLCFM
jgi:hypothetical protein